MNYNCCAKPISSELSTAIKYTRSLWLDALTFQDYLWGQGQETVAALIKQIDKQQTIEA
jgi:hypothetical protein